MIARSAFFLSMVSTPVVLSAETAPVPSSQQSTLGFRARYEPIAQRIISAALEKNDAYRKLEELCLTIGHRLSGSPQLEKAIDWAVEQMKRDGHQNVRREKVMVPHWVRGGESCTMLEPRVTPLVMLGLGGAIATPAEGITGEVLVVAGKEELEQAGDQVKGRIVLFNNVMPSYDPEHGSGYGTAVQYRSRGAIMASERGALATLIRSVTAKSLRTPHTGAMRYDEQVPKIPAAALSVEDAELIARLHALGVPVKVNLKMEARTLPDAESANVLGELRGSTLPDEVVVIGGHIDSWDVGHGAHDDGAGCVMAMEAISVLRRLNLVPRRTIRVVLWTNEENGLAGGKAYAAEHAAELDRHVAAIEADSGGFRPTGYSVECQDEQRQGEAARQLGEIVSLLTSIGPMKVSTGHSGADISAMKPAGVMLMGHNVEGSTYFDYHHTPADTIDKVDPQLLSENVAALATVAFILADIPVRVGEPQPEP